MYYSLACGVNLWIRENHMWEQGPGGVDLSRLSSRAEQKYATVNAYEYV